MPIRVKVRPMSQGDRAPSPHWDNGQYDSDLPDIAYEDQFRDVVKKLSLYIADVIYVPSTFEQLRTTSNGDCLRTLVDHLSTNVTNPSIVNALLALRWHYGTSNDGRGLGEARANACEIVAWRFLTRLSEREAVEYCLYEIPDPSESCGSSQDGDCADRGESNERTALLGDSSSTQLPRSRRRSEHDSSSGKMGSQRRSQLLQSISKLTMSFSGGSDSEDDSGDDPTSSFVHLNALEIAAVADAKRFLSQHVVQKIITGIWDGDIIFWDRLSVHSTKKPRFYNPHTADPFCRLRVPKYLKAFEVMFFAAFMFIFYAVCIEQSVHKVTPMEVMLYIWFAAFFYDEVSEYLDAGSIFYAADVWNVFDVIMIAIGICFAILRFVGLYNADPVLIAIAFDVLSLEALFMVPRICSILSLSPYWGTLIPCLKAMGMDFLKFMVLVAIIYLGFLTTFSLVGRELYTFKHMAMIVTKIFFGSSYVGFDIMNDIDPIFGPPLMFIFVTLSSILLMGSLTGMLSNSFSRVISHAKEEYLYVYSVYVLEASTSNRLTHFYPPFNLIAFCIFRPLRLFLPSNDRFRQARIILLKATHSPIVGAIMLYEWTMGKTAPKDGFGSFRGPRQASIKRSPAPPLTTDRISSRPRFPSPMPTSINQPSRVSKTRQRQQEDDTTDAPTDVEVRIAELSSKIDRLTAMVAGLQSGAAGDDTVRS
ncbi:calcium channel YVC1 [Apiospora saccharicola]|uniref:Calcium channel YVC1 n=1 Tax=Apiospora saccharicola TaxID=335842 RepID=A0ABR1UKG3_9PEZI